MNSFHFRKSILTTNGLKICLKYQHLRLQVLQCFYLLSSQTLHRIGEQVECEDQPAGRTSHWLQRMMESLQQHKVTRQQGTIWTIWDQCMWQQITVHDIKSNSMLCGVKWRPETKSISSSRKEERNVSALKRAADVQRSETWLRMCKVCAYY